MKKLAINYLRLRFLNTFVSEVEEMQQRGKLLEGELFPEIISQHLPEICFNLGLLKTHKVVTTNRARQQVR